jgi:RNA-binding protein
MEPLTGKQKSHLRSLGQTLEPQLKIGKAGLTPGVAKQLASIFAHRELVKTHLPAGPAADRNKLAEDLAAACGAQLVGLIGRSALLYRQNEELAEKDRIDLP